MRFKTQTVTIGDVVELVIDHRGKTPKKMGFDDFHAEGYPVLSAKHVKTDYLANTDAIRFANEEMYKKWMKVEIQKGDIALTSEAPLGEVFYLDGETKYLLGQRIFGLRPNKEKIDPLYFSAWLASPIGQSQLKSRSTGSTVQGIKQSELLKVEIDLPPMSMQKAIGRIRRELSEKITNNTQMNQTLEKIAQRIFKSWFIDFDPVKANVEGMPFDGLSPEIQALFPNELVESEMGMIPKGWEVTLVSDIADVVKGKSYKSTELNPSKTALVTLKSFQRGGGYRLDGYKEYTGKYKDSQIVDNGDLIIAYTDMTQAADVIGKPAMISGNDKYDCLVISLDVGAIKPKESNLKNFLYYTAMSSRFTDHTRSFSSGTTVLHLGKDAVPSFEFACPPPEVLCKFDEVVAPFIEKISNSIMENKNLTKIRDRLLPKLISGQIEIKNEADISA
jgi:type I restriction enzyme S subunit